LFSFVFVGKKALSIPADILAASSDYLDRFADTGMLTPIPDIFTRELNLPDSNPLDIGNAVSRFVKVDRDGNACCQ
jgi:hypothetical protein